MGNGEKKKRFFIWVKMLIRFSWLKCENQIECQVKKYLFCCVIENFLHFRHDAVMMVMVKRLEFLVPKCFRFDEITHHLN